MPESSNSPPSGNRAANANEIDEAALGDMARKAYADRRRRENIAGADGLFAEPAWDILLELFIAARESRQIARNAPWVSATMSETSAQRWLAILETRGLAVGDGEFVKLSPAACAGMADYFRRS